MKYKKFILFGMRIYEESGGLEDIVDSFDTDSEAMSAMMRNEQNFNYSYIVDRDTWKKIATRS